MLMPNFTPRSVRQMAQEQFFLMATRCCMGHRPLLFFITLLFTVLGVSVLSSSLEQSWRMNVFHAFVNSEDVMIYSPLFLLCVCSRALQKSGLSTLLITSLF